MSLARLKRVSICGRLDDKQEILEGLQELGCLHLIPLTPIPAEIEKAASPRADDTMKALKFLSEFSPRRRQILRETDFDVDLTVNQVLMLKQQLRDASDRRDFLQDRIEDVEPWGEITFPRNEALGGQYFWFYELPVTKREALDSLALPWQIVQADQRIIRVVVISPSEPSVDLLPVRRTKLGALPLSQLREQLEDAEIEIEELTGQRQSLTRFIFLIKANIAVAENRAQLTYAEQQTRDGDQIVAVQGWAPVDNVAQIEAFAHSHGLATLIEDPGPDDAPPTLIEQPEELGAGVDLAQFYQLPSYRSWDPTILLMVSFAVFFAMILSDAGYGLLLMVGLLFYWRPLGQTAQGRAYRLMGVGLVGATIVYGIMVGSYFGISAPEGTLLSALQVMKVDDFDTMMTISIVIGVVHICLANLISASVSSRTVAFSKYGWVAAIVGGLLLWLAPADSAWRTLAIALLMAGGVAIVLYGSERAVRAPIDVVWRLLDGVQSLFGAMGAFGDVLSYMRLFALGLASASLASTFNDLALGANAALPGLGKLAAILLLVIGHGLNLGLSLMSGVVHGLRLNFIEFYKWGLPDEGTPFRRFARKEVAQ